MDLGARSDRNHQLQQNFAKNFCKSRTSPNDSSDEIAPVEFPAGWIDSILEEYNEVIEVNPAKNDSVGIFDADLFELLCVNISAVEKEDKSLIENCQPNFGKNLSGISKTTNSLSVENADNLSISSLSCESLKSTNENDSSQQSEIASKKHKPNSYVLVDGSESKISKPKIFADLDNFNCLESIPSSNMFPRNSTPRKKDYSSMISTQKEVELLGDNIVHSNLRFSKNNDVVNILVVQNSNNSDMPSQHQSRQHQLLQHQLPQNQSPQNEPFSQNQLQQYQQQQHQQMHMPFQLQPIEDQAQQQQFAQHQHPHNQWVHHQSQQYQPAHHETPHQQLQQNQPQQHQSSQNQRPVQHQPMLLPIQLLPPKHQPQQHSYPQNQPSFYQMLHHKPQQHQPQQHQPPQHQQQQHQYPQHMPPNHQTPHHQIKQHVPLQHKPQLHQPPYHNMLQQHQPSKLHSSQYLLHPQYKPLQNQSPQYQLPQNQVLQYQHSQHLPLQNLSLQLQPSRHQSPHQTLQNQPPQQQLSQQQSLYQFPQHQFSGNSNNNSNIVGLVTNPQTDGTNASHHQSSVQAMAPSSISGPIISISPINHRDNFQDQHQLSFRQMAHTPSVVPTAWTSNNLHHQPQVHKLVSSSDSKPMPTNLHVSSEQGANGTEHYLSSEPLSNIIQESWKNASIYSDLTENVLDSFVDLSSSNLEVQNSNMANINQYPANQSHLLGSVATNQRPHSSGLEPMASAVQSLPYSFNHQNMPNHGGSEQLTSQHQLSVYEMPALPSISPNTRNMALLQTNHQASFQFTESSPNNPIAGLHSNYDGTNGITSKYEPPAPSTRRKRTSKIRRNKENMPNSKIEIHKCEFCRATFKKISSLHKHRKMHIVTPKYVCLD